MQFKTGLPVVTILHSTIFLLLCSPGLILTGCSSSSEPAAQPTPTNEIPVAADDIFSANKGGSTTLDLASNDSDADDGLDLSSITLVTSPANGAVTINSDGTIDYTHDGSDTASDNFSYTIKDNSAAVSNSATVTINITTDISKPVAGNDTFSVTKGSTSTLDLAANDSDTDDGLELASIVLITSPVNGAITINSDGTIDYTHNGSTTLSDTFSYTIKDNSNQVSNIATVSITITPVPNVAPVAVDDSFTVPNGSTSTLDLAANDSDADGVLNLASIALITSPVNGAITINSDGTIDYTHNGSTTLSDTFSYTIKDDIAETSNSASVNITVTPSTPPVAHIGIYGSTVVEGADDLEFVVSLSQASSETISVDYATSNGTATAGTDYTAAANVLSFAPGETRKLVPVSVLNNASAWAGSSKNMQLILSNPVNAELDHDTATGTIIDSDHISTDTPFTENWTAVGTFTNATVCANGCHVSDGSKMDFSGTDVSPGTQWKHSVMANSFNDPYWQAAVEDEASSFPALAGFIEDTCTKCHAPMGRTHAHHTNTSLDIEGFYRFDTAKAQNHAREGVSCTACHQIEKDNLGSDDSFSGEFIIDPNTKNAYGQYSSVTNANRMRNVSGFTPVPGEYIAESALCATCHTLYTPSLDPDTGLPTGATPFMEQGVYFEWQNSVYGDGVGSDTQCQGCHMPEPEPGYSTSITLDPSGAPSHTPYGQHTLVGGNSHLLEILRDYQAELGITGTTDAGFNKQIALTQELLASSASLSVSALTANDDTLEFAIEVSNLAGHKLPTAYPSRRTWLHVVVKNGANQTIFESGAPDARGYISTDEARLKADCMSAHKLDGFDSSLCYEPHRDVITDESQVAIYETVLGDINGDITHTLLQASQYLKDNRIPPEGFTNSEADSIESQTIPAGVTGDADFNCVSGTEGCGADTVHYQVDINGQTGPYTAEVRLLYQATQPGFVDGMHNVGERINRFKVMYDAVPPTVEVLATASK